MNVVKHHELTCNLSACHWFFRVLYFHDHLGFHECQHEVLASCETVTDKRGAAQTRLSTALAGHEEIAPGSTLLEVLAS